MADGVVPDAVGEGGGGNDAGGGPVGGQGDAAVKRVVVDLVAGDEVVLAGAGFIADENAAGVVVALVVANGGVIGAHEVDALAAVVALVGFKGGDVGAGAGGDVERLVVAVDVVVGEGDVGAVDDEDAFEVGVADVEAGDDDVGDAGFRGCRAVTCSL